MSNDKHIEHVGDGVYAEWDGFQIILRVNHHQSLPSVYLEPSTMKELNKFYEKHRRIASDLEKREAPSDEEIEDAYRQYQIETIGFDVYEKGAFTSGAEWMRNKLTGK